MSTKKNHGERTKRVIREVFNGNEAHYEADENLAEEQKKIHEVEFDYDTFDRNLAEIRRRVLRFLCFWKWGREKK